MGSSFETRNFGFRRFTNIVREGRFRSPDAPTQLRLGTLVEIDLTDPEKVQEVTVNSTGAVGADVKNSLVGVLWYEHDSQTMEGRAASTLNVDMNWAPPGRMVQVIHGPGVKVWMRNTLADTTEAGLNYPSARAAVTLVTGLGAAGVDVGDLLGWDDVASAYEVTTTPAEAVMRVTYVDDDLALLEAEMVV